MRNQESRLSTPRQGKREIAIEITTVVSLYISCTTSCTTPDSFQPMVFELVLPELGLARLQLSFAQS